MQLCTFMFIAITDLELMGFFDCSTNATNVIVTWTNATSPYCGGVLYYMVQLSSDNMIIDDLNVTNLSSLTVTFRNLRNNTDHIYEVAVTAGNSVGVGITINESIRTFTPMPPQPPTNSSNNTSSHVCITI